MKNLKVILVAAAIASANIALAQESVAPAKQTTTTTKGNDDSANREARANKQVVRVDGMCQLKDDQKAKVKKLYLDSYENIEHAKKDAGTDAAKAETAVTKIQKQRNDDLLKILTPEQRKKYHEENKSNHHEDAPGEQHDSNQQEPSK